MTPGGTTAFRILAVADSESFLKWAATTLDRLAADDPATDVRLVVVKGPLEPSPGQVGAALSGTTAENAPVVSRRGLKELVKTFRPDAVLVAATGPVAEMIARTTLRAAEGARPVLFSGPPGMAMSAAATTGVKWRYRWCDVYVVHSPREVDLFAAAFARHGAHPRMVLSRLPFLGERSGGPPMEVTRVVFAPQSIAPHTRSDRVAILEGLAALYRTGLDVIVKVRTLAGEQQTHHEALPFDVLWRQEHARIGLPRGALRFAAGPMREWLAPGTALVTVSSTAALEALSLGLPTALLSDFGIGPALGNEVYEGSGCLVRLADLADVLRQGGPLAHEGWLASTYLHDHPGDLRAALEDVAAVRSAGRPTRSAVRPVNVPVAAYTALKSDVPALWLPARWTRALVGRFVKLH